MFPDCKRAETTAPAGRCARGWKTRRNRGESAVEQYRVGFCTLGCKVSQYETEAICEEFLRWGFVRGQFDGVCDVYVINTCTVTGEADRKSRQCIRRALHNNPRAIVMVTGCYAQTSYGEIAQIPGVSYVCGTYGKMQLPARALEMLTDPPAVPEVAVTPLGDAPFERMRITDSPRTRAYVKIEDGCECRCTYCAIPAARGRVRSKPMADVLGEVEALARGGTREVVLTGIETASWGTDLDGARLTDLLAELDRRHYVDRIRLGSLSPEWMTPDTIGRLAEIGTLAPHFHLSMQSGSDRILRAMKRRYLTDRALDSLARLRRAIPGVQFTTDMMVGFPGEGEAEFEETLAFARAARFLDMHVFAYSRRRGTPADTYPDQVPEAVKSDRSHRLIALKNEIRSEILSDVVAGQPTLRLLPETLDDGVWHGHSDEFMELALPQDPRVHHGETVRVLPCSHAGGVLHVRLADSDPTTNDTE